MHLNTRELHDVFCPGSALILDLDLDELFLVKSPELSKAIYCFSASVLIGTPCQKPYSDTPASQLLTQMMRKYYPILPRHIDLDRQKKRPQPPLWKQLRPDKELTTRTCLQW